MEDYREDKQKEYNDRYRFWTQQALSQFGATTNFFYVISVGLFAFLIKSNSTEQLLVFDCSRDFSYYNFFLISSIIITFLSIGMGSITVLSRLHDLRSTRHIVFVRKGYYDKKRKSLTSKHIDINKYSFCSNFILLFDTFFNREYFIKKTEYNDDTIILKKFQKLRTRNLRLARLSWFTLNMQIMFLTLAILFYLFASLIK